MSDWQGEGEVLRFRGTPRSLSAAVREPDAAPRRSPVRLELPSAERWQGSATVSARASRQPDGMVMRMSLPPRTPPGEYEATMDVDGVERRILIEVEPEVELHLVPEQLTLHARPGEHVEVQLTLVNAGNVPVDIRRTHAVGLFAVGGIERALHQLYVGTREKEGRSADELLDRLAEEHGGVLRVAVEDGSGEIAPGETRELRAIFRVPERLHGGRVYTGTWPLYDLEYYVRLVVPDGDSPKSASAAS